MIICGTGHRPDKLGGYSTEAYDKLLSVARTALVDLQPRKVISGMALGWDQALIEAAQRLAIPTIAAVPFRGQERRWPAASREKFQSLLDDAFEIVYVCEDGYAPWKMQVRNEWMVNNADLVLALWNGSKGGTANCVDFARKVQKPVVNVWELFDKLP